MGVQETGRAAQRAELDAGLGPFDDPDWRDGLALLGQSVRAAAMFLAADCTSLVSLARRVPRSPGDERGGTPWTSFVREVAVAKKVSDQAAHAELALADRLLGRHPRLLRALQTGSVPAPRARLLVEECARYTDPVAAVADRLLTDRLGSLPPWRIRHEVTLLALRLDPDGAARREAVATAGRSASLTALPDAQAEAVLTGPAPLVQRWWDALTDQARALKAAGDPRSLTALRFDLAVHTDPTGLLGHDDLAVACGIDDPRPDASSNPETPETYGPATSEPAVDGVPSGSAPVRHGLQTDLPGDARCSRPVQATITVPAATALGLADEPGWLDGYGWISAPLSRNLLTVAELRKACVAPHTGELIDRADRVHRPTSTAQALRAAVRDMVLTPHELRPTATDDQPQHDPSPALEALVHARDRWCDGPTGTRTPARRTDTDHHDPWPAGPTRASNLVSRAPRTHQLKHAGWAAVRDGTGTTWTSPAGQTAFTPRFDHPPPRLTPGTAQPGPAALARRRPAAHPCPRTSPPRRRSAGPARGRRAGGRPDSRAGRSGPHLPRLARRPALLSGRRARAARPARRRGRPAGRRARARRRPTAPCPRP